MQRFSLAVQSIAPQDHDSNLEPIGATTYCLSFETQVNPALPGNYNQAVGGIVQ